MHKFQPILTAQKYTEALEYIASQAEELCRQIIGQRLSIDTLTIFAQAPKEYDFIKNLISTKGPVSHFTHGSTLYIEVDGNVHGRDIKLLGIRQPDASRSEVGYADFPVADLKDFSNRPFVNKIISGRGEKLLELRHPNFDVRGYIVER